MPCQSLYRGILNYRRVVARDTWITGTEHHNGRRPMRKLLSLSVAGLLALAIGACQEGPTQLEQSEVPAADRATAQSIEPVLTFGAMEEVGTSRLVRSADAITTRTNTSALVPRHVTTLWWVIFNNPEECSDGTCGADDLFEPTDAKPSCPYADGSIVGGNGDARYQDRLTVGEDRNSCIEFLVGANEELEGEDHGLLNPEGAEIHVVVRSHGPLIPGKVPEMRSTFAGACEDFLEAGTVPDEQGECADLQFAVHAP